eukprot:4490146-Amphidinium_carterae.1
MSHVCKLSVVQQLQKGKGFWLQRDPSAQQVQELLAQHFPEVSQCLKDVWKPKQFQGSGDVLVRVKASQVYQFLAACQKGHLPVQPSKELNEGCKVHWIPGKNLSWSEAVAIMEEHLRDLPACLTHAGTKWTAAVALVSKWHVDHMAYGVRVPESHYHRVQMSFGTDAKQRYTLKGCPRRWDAEDVTSVCRQANWEVQVVHTLGRSGTWLLKSEQEPARWCLTVVAQQERHQLALARYEAKQVAPTAKVVKQEPGLTWTSVLHADLVISEPSGDAKQATEPQPKQAPRIVEWAEAADSDSDEDENSQEDEKLWEQVGLDGDEEDWTKPHFQEEVIPAANTANAAPTGQPEQ